MTRTAWLTSPPSNWPPPRAETSMARQSSPSSGTPTRAPPATNHPATPSRSATPTSTPSGTSTTTNASPPDCPASPPCTQLDPSGNDHRRTGQRSPSTEKQGRTGPLGNTPTCLSSVTPAMFTTNAVVPRADAREPAHRGRRTAAAGNPEMASGLRRPRHTPRLLDEGTTTRAGLHASPARVRVTERSEIANSGAFPGGYIGESTSREIAYAHATGKPIAFTHPF